MAVTKWEYCELRRESIKYYGSNSTKFVEFEAGLNQDDFDKNIAELLSQGWKMTGMSLEKGLNTPAIIYFTRPIQQ